MPTNTSTSRTDTDMLRGQSKTVIIAIGVSTVLLLILSSAIVLTVVVLVWNYKRRSAKQELYTEHSYSTLSRGSEQSQSIHHNSTQFYDQVHLSPFTGQTEFIPKSESTNINNPSTTLQIFHPTLSTAGDDRAEHFSVLNTEHLETTPQLSSQTAYESTVICEQPTYAAVDKSKKEKIKKQTRKEDSKCKVTEKGFHVSSYRNEVSSASMQEKKEKAEEQVINPPHMIEELYTAVKKKPKGSEPKDEDKIPPMPPHTIEELYTAVEKKPRSNADENKEASPKTLNFVPEDLHTAVARKLEGGLTDGTEAAPPIPPHTVEELYTAVMKKPKGSAEDEEEAPPIPPYTVDEN